MTLTAVQWAELGTEGPTPVQAYCGVWTPGTRPPAKCGTDSGYYRHRDQGIDPCARCTRAHTDAEIVRYHRRARRRAGLADSRYR